jgi:hypothetical protein
VTWPWSPEKVAAAASAAAVGDVALEPRPEKRAAAASKAAAVIGDVAVESRARRGEELRLWKPLLLVTWPWNQEPREERNSGLGSRYYCW